MGLRFNWRRGEETGAASGPEFKLKPFETQRINVDALQSSGVIPSNANWTSVTLTTKGLPDEVIAVTASFDQTLKYGAQTPFSDQLSFRWEGGMWEYDAQHDSLISVGNGGTKATEAALTIFYNGGNDRYELEQLLQPDQQMLIDVGKLIREHTPDKTGKTLPEDLAMGSYEIRDLHNTGVGVLFEGKIIYDKTYGHAVYGCASCCGYSTTVPWYNPIGVPVYTATGDGVNSYNTCSSVYDDVSTSFYNNWSSANTSLVTVDAYGTHTGHATGSTTSGTYGQLQSNHQRLCPILAKSPSGGVNVKPNITGISPPDGLIGNTVSVSISGKGFGTSPTIIAPAGVTPTIQSSSDTQISATLALSTSVTPGNQAIQVKNSQSLTTSNSANFFVQVPKTLVRSPDFGANGLGPVNSITNGSVIDISGNTLLTNQCGVYENIGYQLVDQRTPAQYIYGNYTLHEHFSNYTSTVAGHTVPADVNNPIALSQTILGDTQYYGKTAPACPGSNDHEQFDQSLSVIVGTTSYPLSMVNTIKRGFYSGTGNVTLTIKVP